MSYPPTPPHVPPPGMPPLPPQMPMMPPPMYFPPPPRRSLGAALFTGAMVTVLGCSLTLNFWLLVLGGLGMMWNSSDDVDKAKTETVVKGNALTKVYEIPITGVIDDKTFARFDGLLKKAEEDSATKAIIVSIDTPGGGVTASDQIYSRILKFKESSKLPVVITQGGLATSGGYYISAAGDYILAERTTLTGNIGVLMPMYNVADLMNKYGVTDSTIVSSGTPYKDAGSPTKYESPEQRKYLQNLIDTSFKTFKSVVVTGRGSKLTKSIDEIANGKAYSADEAKALGLVDALGNRNDALAYLAKTHGVTTPEVVKLEEPATLSSLLGITSNLKNGETKLDISRSVLDPILTPRPMYLWRGF